MYKTIQYKSLCDFFERGTKEQYTLDEIIEAVCPGGAGKSTVYRQLARMTETGELRKFHDGKRILYQYSHISPDCGSHFHLKCISCGRLIHLNCDSSPATWRRTTALPSTCGKPYFTVSAPSAAKKKRGSSNDEYKESFIFFTCFSHVGHPWGLRKSPGGGRGEQRWRHDHSGGQFPRL